MINLIDNDNISWSFFIDNKNNLCCTYGQTPTQIILEKCTNEFDSFLDKKGIIHIIVQKVDGEMCYIKHYKEKWEKYIVMKTRYGKQSFSNIRLFVIMGNVEVYYTLYHNYRYYLVRHIISVDNQKSPTVINYTYNGKFSIVYDNNIIHILYKDEEHQLIYHRYNPDNNSFIKENIKLSENIKDFSIAVYYNILSVVYVTRCKKHYTVNYTDFKNFNIKTLGFGIDTFCIPYIYHDKNILNILWEERYFLYSTKTNNGENFSKINIANKTGILVEHKYLNNKIEYKIKSTY